METHSYLWKASLQSTGSDNLVPRVIAPLTSGRERETVVKSKKAIFDWLKNRFSFLPFSNSKLRFLVDFYLYEFEDDPEINLFTTYHFRNVFVFENIAFGISELSLAWHQILKSVLIEKCLSLFLIRLV